MLVDPSIFTNRSKNNLLREDEKIMYEIINKTFQFNDNIIRGNDKLGEPDYIEKDKSFGYEMTLITGDNNDSFFYFMNKAKENREATRSANGDQFIQWLCDGVRKKAEKKYSIARIRLVVMFPEHFPPLTEPDVYLVAKDPKYQKLFEDLYEEYINAKIFEEIFIIVPTPEKKMSIYTVSQYTAKLFMLPYVIDWKHDDFMVL